MEEESALSKLFSLIILAITLSIISIFNNAGELMRGVVSGLSVAVLMSVAANFWHLKRSLWYWFLVVLLATAHLVLAIKINWSGKEYMGFLSGPLMLLDAGIVYIAFRSLQGFLRKE
jgi:hypothetical protein